MNILTVTALRREYFLSLQSSMLPYRLTDSGSNTAPSGMDSEQLFALPEN